MHFRRSCRLLLLCLLTLLLGVGTSVAQAVYGSIFGTVTDASGAAVAGAKVTVTDVRKGTVDTTVTNVSGNFQVQHLIPDTYDVKIEAKGFKTIENKGVLVSADTSARVDASFQVGGATEVVEVTSEAPQLKTDRADVAELLDEHVTADLPLANRNFTSLELLAPGAVFQSGWQHASTENPQESQQIFVNGQKFGGTSWQLDGTDNKDPVLGIIVINPTLESVNEIKITTQNFDAEFGNATAGIITAQTKSGSNNFHGSVFEFRRSGANQARDPFLQSTPDKITGRYIPPTLWNQFGGSIGGPVIKNKLFFFGDYQGTRSKVGTNVQASVPTTLVRNTCLSGGTADCDLSEYLSQGQVYDPTKGTVDGKGRPAYAGNLIPQGALNPAAIKILSKLPAPNRPGDQNGTQNNYVTSGTGNLNGDAFNTRVDYQLKQNFHIFGRYSYVKFTQLGPPSFGSIGGPGFLSNNGTGNDLSRDDSVAAGFDYAVNSTLLTDFRFGFFRYHIDNKKYDAGNLTAATDLGLPGLNIAGRTDTSGLPSFNFSGNGSLSGFGDVNCNCPLNENEKQLQFVNNWTKIARNHSFKFGVDLRYAMNLRDASDNNRTGQFTFDAKNTASGDVDGSGNPLGGGLALATMLTGNATSFARFVIASNNAGEHQKRFFLYGQDTWRVTPKLTLTLGLRWEDVFPETVSEKGQGGFVDLASGYVKVAGFAGNPTNGGQANNLTNFAPRIGAAYQLNPKTAIRAGYGRSFDEGIFGLVFGTAMTHNIPVVASQSLSAADPHSAAFNLSTGPVPYVFPTIPSNGLIPLQNGVNYPSVRPAKMKLVAVDAYNLSIQHQIDSSTSVEVAYVGNWGAHVPAGYAGYNINQPVVGPGAQNLRKPLYNRYNNNGTMCCDQGIALVSPDAHSSYNSLQTQINRRMSHGLQLSAFYTWSKAFDHSDDYFANNPEVQYGQVDYNRKHVFTTNVIYDLPFGKGKMFGGNSSKLVDLLIGGFQVSSITSVASGLPFTWSYQHAGDDVDSGPGRPDKVGYFATGAGKLDTTNHLVHYFTPVAPMLTNGQVSGPWRRPQAYTFGNSGRNTGWGPGMFTSDLSLSKNLPITEQVKGQFKMDVYNLFNHPVLGMPNSCVDCGGGGTINSLQGYTYMRRLQFGARFSF